jgi:S1-C subfamily serine protease
MRVFLIVLVVLAALAGFGWVQRDWVASYFPALRKYTDTAPVQLDSTLAPRRPVPPAPVSAPAAPVLPGQPAPKKYTLDDISQLFFRPISEISVMDENDRLLGTANAFIISVDGLVVTSYQAIAGGQRFTISLNGYQKQSREVIAYDANIDVAILKLTQGVTDALTLAETKKEDVPIGTAIAMLGPKQTNGSLGEGIISAYRPLPDFGLEGEFFQLDTSGRKRSGSPVFLMDGRVAGMSITMESGGEHLMFAVPSWRILELLKKRAKINKKLSAQIVAPGVLTGPDLVFQQGPFRRGREAWLKRQYTEARAELEPLLTVYPESPVLMLILADCLSRESVHAQALDLIKKASKLMPAEPFTWDIYGGALERAGYRPQAIQALSHYITLDTHNPDVYARLGRLHAQQNEVPKAIEYYRRALQGNGPRRTWSLELAKLHIDRQEWAEGWKILAPFAENPKQLVDAEGYLILQAARRCLFEQGLDTLDLDKRLKELSQIKSVLAQAQAYQHRVASAPAALPAARKNEIPENSEFYGNWRSGKVSVRISQGRLEVSQGIKNNSADWRMVSPDRATFEFWGSKVSGNFKIVKGKLHIAIPELGSFVMERPPDPRDR